MPSLMSISNGSLLNLSASNKVISNHFITFAVPITYYNAKSELATRVSAPGRASSLALFIK